MMSAIPNILFVILDLNRFIDTNKYDKVLWYYICIIQNYIPLSHKHQINRHILPYLPCKFIKIMYKMGPNLEKYLQTPKNQ